MFICQSQNQALKAGEASFRHLRAPGLFFLLMRGRQGSKTVALSSALLRDDNMLSENDVKVLKAISEGDSDPQSIAEKLGMKVEAVRASADALGEQGMIQVTKSVEEIVSLTEEGTKYAKEGLPERNLLTVIGSGKPMSELKDPAHQDRPGVAAQEGLGGHPGRRDQAAGLCPEGQG